MKAEEKAKEMMIESTRLGNCYCAKRHCLWLCDIILDEIYQKQEYPRYNYWLDVQNEIEKL